MDRKNSLFSLFEKNFDNFTIGFISGLVLYFLTISKQGTFNTALIIFFSGLLLISIYTLLNRLNTFEKSIYKFLGKITEVEFLFYLIMIPSFLILIYLLPHWVSNVFRLNLNEPNLIALFFSNYTHQNFGHLVSNLIAYFLLITLILNIEPNKKEFYGFSLFALLIFPFLIFPITKFFLDMFNITNFPTTIGFSGIAALFNGYFVYSLYKYLKSNAFKDLKLRFIFFLLIFNVTIWAFYNNLYLAIASCIVLLLLFFDNLSGIKNVFIFIRHKIYKQKNGKDRLDWKNFILMIFFLIPLVSLIALIPKELITPAGVVNTPVHFFSLLIGVFLPYLYEVLKFKST